MATSKVFGRMGPRFSRRRFTAAVPALVLATSVRAQSSGLRLEKLHCFEIRVSDVARSMRFYQDLFGMPVQARSSDRVCLRIGDGPGFMAVRALETGETPAITYLGYSVEDFAVGRALAALEAIGFERIDAPPLSDPGLAHAMKTWTRQRDDAVELYFADARGLVVALSDGAYCGADTCRLEPSGDGRIRLAEINHFTAFVNGGAEANDFYQRAFDLSVQAYQGPQSPVTGIGDGRQFVMYAGGRRDTATPANIHHGSFNMHDFDVERVRATLTDYGLTARDDARGAEPLVHYVSLRMPARGGAEGGTPELYFTDPDGILLQLQDLSYCGGGGYLGNECSTD